MLLAIDIGNTDIVFAVYYKNEWTHSWRKRSDVEKSAVTYELDLRNCFLEKNLLPQFFSGVVISSVVPQLGEVIKEMAEAVFSKNILAVEQSIYAKLKIGIGNPQEIGTDLVANAVAAYDKYNDCCVVIDFGTALTFTTLDKEGNILGVAIAPGIRTAMKSLSSSTAQLPEIPLEIPESVIGKDTVHAIQAGILHGYVGLVEGMMNRINEEIGTTCKVVATGGLSPVLKPLHASFDDIEPLLTLDGLRIIYDQCR